MLPKMYGQELVNAFGKFKAIFDPQGQMNPSKVVDPYTPDQNLRHGAKHYHPDISTKTYFQFPNDGGSCAKAVNRCVGVGKCRRDEGGVMCHGGEPWQITWIRSRMRETADWTFSARRLSPMAIKRDNATMALRLKLRA